MIITMKSMFCHGLQRPLYSSNVLELKQSKQTCHIRCLCGKHLIVISMVYTQTLLEFKKINTTRLFHTMGFTKGYYSDSG